MARFDSKFLKSALLRLMLEPHLLTKHKKFIDSSLFNVSGNDSALAKIADTLIDWGKREESEPTPDGIWSKLNLMPDSELRTASLNLFNSMRMDEELVRLAKSDQVFGDFLKYVKCKVLITSHEQVNKNFKDGNYEGAFKSLEDGLNDIKSISVSDIQNADWDNSMEFLEDESNRPDKKFLLGIDDFDLNSGFEPQTLNLFVAMTGGGKTMCTVHLVRQAIKQQKYIYVAVVEDRKVSFLRRLYASMTDIPLNRLKNFHNLNPADRKKMLDAQQKLKKYVTVEFIYGQPPDFINARMKELITLRKSKGQPAYEAAVIDYLQHIAPIGSGESEHQKLSMAMARLKDFALEQNLAIFTHQQINRDGARTTTKGDGGLIGMAELSTSFQVSFVCDTIISINRTEKMKEADEALFLVLKGREGSTDKKYIVKTRFDKAQYHMDDWYEVGGMISV